MSETMAQVPADSPLMQAWERYKDSVEFANTRRWMAQGVACNDDQIILGQFWAAFMAGFDAVSQDSATAVKE